MSTNIFNWDESYSVHSNLLDDQHKELFNITNDLYEAFSKNAHKDHLGEYIERLYQYTLYHFSQEERMLREMGNKLTPEHLKKHRDFEAKVGEFREKFKEGKVNITYEMMNFLRTWLTDHIKGTDKEYSNVFKA